MSALCFNLTGLGMTLQKPADLKEPTENDEGYSLIELDSSLPKYKEIAVDFNHAGLKVLKIEQLDNHLLWQKYMAEKNVVLKRKPQDPDFEINEKYLYHGTTAKKEFICTEGLDTRLSSKRCRFGPGIYFSDNPQKCVKYAEKGRITQFIVMARVILGCPKKYPQGQTDKFLVREPVKKFPCKGWRFYDSVQGSPKDYKEFVIYRNDKALIECIVTYENAPFSIPSTTSLSTSISTTKSLFKPVDSHVSKVSVADDENESNSDTSDEDEKVKSADTRDEDEKNNSSDSDKEEVLNGNSSDSDSSFEHNDSDRMLSDKHRNEIRSASTMPQRSTEKRGEDILADKKKEFVRRTGESRQHVIESFLSTTALDVDKAVNLFLDKDKKKKEKEREQRRREMKQKEESSNEVDVYEDAACAFVTPASDPEQWKRMGTEDKEAIIEALTENFLIVIGLDDSAENRKLSRKILFSCDCDLDSSIVAYYESL